MRQGRAPSRPWPLLGVSSEKLVGLCSIAHVLVTPSLGGASVLLSAPELEDLWNLRRS